MSSGLLVILVCHAEYEAKHIVACDFTNEIVFPALKSAKSCQTVNIVHLSEQKVIFYRASFTSPCTAGGKFDACADSICLRTSSAAGAFGTTLNINTKGKGRQKSTFYSNVQNRATKW